MEIQYKDGYAYFDGYKFRKDTKRGYYLSTKNIGSSRMRLHVYIWEYHNGSVPAGYQIHHKDENKDNNEIENLACMTKKEHLNWHGENMSEERKEESRENLKKAQLEAAKWHSSPEGIEWHKKHAANSILKIKYYDSECLECGKKFKSEKPHGKFCSPNCRSNYRRKSGVDNEVRKCAVCGNEYSVNRYSKSKSCSRECRGKLRKLNNAKNRR